MSGAHGPRPTAGTIVGGRVMPRVTNADLFRSHKALRTDPRNAAGPGVDSSAPTLTWGGPSNFSFDAPFGFEVRNAGYQEISRNSAVRRVTNPQDEDQWVDVEEIRDVTFKDQDRKLHNYKFKAQQ